MEFLFHLFPRSDFGLIAAIVAFPLIGAFVNGVFGKRLGNEAVSLVALTAVGVPFVAAAGACAMLASAQSETDAAVRFSWLAWEWLSMGGQGPSAADMREFHLNVSFSYDALSSVMCLIITGIGLLTHVYSSKDMAGEPGYSRFFAYLNLLVFSMLVLVLGDSLPLLFVGWQGVGLSTYLLTGFWFQEEAHATAAKRAFIANRVGDFGLLVAMGLLGYHVGALDWAGIDAARGALLKPQQIWPVGETVPIAALMPPGIAEWLNAPRYLNAAFLVALALVIGAMGKSAQFGLHTWLPDSTASPAPASALIHAATTLIAGVYLLCRLASVIALSPLAMAMIAGVGALTAFFAATVALVQNDIRKVLAFAAISQVGYMFIGLGVGAFSAGFFHVLTHACFMSCLILGAGSVIRAMRTRIRDAEGATDLRNMGGLMKFMPLTSKTFIAAGAATVGLPLTSGFFSRDQILAMARSSYVGNGDDIWLGRSVRMETLGWAQWYGNVLYAVGLVAALITAFAVTRLVHRVFFGEFRGWKIVDGWEAPHVDESGRVEHEEPGVENIEGPTPQESARQITTPLAALAVLSVFLGGLNAHAFFQSHLFDDFLAPVFQGAASQVQLFDGHESFGTVSVALSIVVAFGAGAGLAWWMYDVQKGKPAARLAKKYAGLRSFLADGWRFDELYEETVIGAIDSLAHLCVVADRWVVDGFLVRFPSFMVAVFGTILRQLQTGRLPMYGATMATGLVLVGCYIVVPQDNVRIDADHDKGQYKITATPGFGYKYRWDTDDEAEGFDTEEFSDTAEVAFTLKPNKAKTVILQVENAFGFVNEETFEIARPILDMSGGGPILRLERGADGKIRPARPDGGSIPIQNNHPSQMREVKPGTKRAPTLEELQKNMEQEKTNGGQQ